MRLIEAVTEEVAGVLSKIKQEEIDLVVSKITKDKRVFVSGEGRNGFVAKGFAMRLMHLGYTAYVIGETITPAMTSDDVIVAVSGSGESTYVVADVAKAKKIGSTIITVVSKIDSTIAKNADVIFCVPGTVRGEEGEGRKSIQLLSSLFDQSAHIALDVVCLAISQRDNMSNEAATNNHW